MGPKKFFSPKKCLVQQDFGSENNVGLKKNWFTQIFGTEKIVGPNKFMVENKFWVHKIF